MPEQVTTCDIILKADDAKVVGASADEHKQRVVHRDLDMIRQWSEYNHLPLSIDKCMCVRYDHHNPKLSYFINSIPIKDTEQCMDLGVLKTSNFRYNSHIGAVCLKTSLLSGMVAKLFSTRNSEFLVKIFTAYTRPLLEYSSVIWSPQKVGLITQVERVQRRFTRRLFGRSAPTYEDRLHLLDLPSLSDRKKFSDLSYANKLLHGLVDVNDAASLSVTVPHGVTRAVALT